MALSDPGFRAVRDDEPQAGWWRRQFVKRGPWVPVRIWLHQVIDPDTGELLEPEDVRCTVGNDRARARWHWPFCMANPITEVEYLRLLDLHTHDPAYRAYRKPFDLTRAGGTA